MADKVRSKAPFEWEDHSVVEVGRLGSHVPVRNSTQAMFFFLEHPHPPPNFSLSTLVDLASKRQLPSHVIISTFPSFLLFPTCTSYYLAILQKNENSSHSSFRVVVFRLVRSSKDDLSCWQK
jgi:hypothetical protein